MSFKRDGDDSHMLSTQRNRRVADLLHEDIHGGELARLSNGRFVCKYCPHQPIFDTVNMFMVHKNGKRHQQSLLYQEQKDQELKDLIEKRKHEHLSILQESVDHQVAEPSRRPPSKHSRQRKPYDRRPVLDIEAPEGATICMETTPLDALPGNKFTTTHGYSGKSTHTDSSGSVNMKNQSSQKFVPKYKPDNCARSHEKELTLNVKTVSKFVGNHLNEQSVKYYKNRKEQGKKAQTLVQQQLSSQSTPLAPPRDPFKSWEFYRDKKGTMKTLPPSLRTPSSAPEPSTKLPSTAEPGGQQESMSKEKKAQLQKELQAIRSGWKRGWDGQWVKDEDAEFDSDEEEPDLS